METKALPLEMKDLSMEKGEAVIAHAVYDSVDLVNDIARRGMFTKSWKEVKMADGTYDVAVYKNHDENIAVGKVLNLFDDEHKAYTHIKFGTHTEGQDMLKQLDEGIARKASFGYNTLKSNKNTKGARELKEVRHLETSPLTKLGAHPGAGVLKVVKSLQQLQVEFKMLNGMEQKFVEDMIGIHGDAAVRAMTFANSLPVESDMYTTAHYWAGQMNDMCSNMKSQIRYNTDWRATATKSLDEVNEIKSLMGNLRKFIRNSKASDAAIQEAEAEYKSLEQALELNTDDTQTDITEPTSSDLEIKALTDGLSILLFEKFD